MKVKVCGITRKEDAELIASRGAWAIGFIFYGKSPRYIEPEKAKIIADAVSGKVKIFGVFVNAGHDEIINVANQVPLDVIQLHGLEGTIYLERLRKFLPDVELVKAVHEGNIERDFEADYYLLDQLPKGSSFGGRGELANWSLKNKIPKDKRVILAGGISSDNVLDAINEVKPFAVDLSSSLEEGPGLKGHKKINDFFDVMEESLGEDNVQTTL